MPASRLIRHALASLIFVAALLHGRSVSAQVADSFDDGDFGDEPTWSGDIDRWMIGELNGPALQSNGVAASDTIHLSTPSETAYGTWRFTVAHQAVNLSAFNGIRIFLTSDRPDPRSSGEGYYVQLGTNNGDAVSLWRSDGSLTTQRVELGRSAEGLVAGDSSTSFIVVDRDIFGRFQVYVDEKLVISASDNRYTNSSFFAVWVKHTAAGSRSFHLDDLFVRTDDGGDMGPIPQKGDIVINEVLFDPAPRRSEFVELLNRGTSAFDLRLLRMRDGQSADVPISYTQRILQPGSHALLVADSTAFGAAFGEIEFIPVGGWPALNNGGDAVVVSGPEGFLDSLSYDGTETTRDVSLERIDPDAPSESYNFGPSTDPSGSTPGLTNSIYTVDEHPPRIRFVEQTGPKTLEVHFDEVIRADELDPSSFAFDAEVFDVTALSPTAIRLHLEDPPSSPSIGIDRVRDRKGNRADRLEHLIAFAPRPGDFIFSEIMFEPLANEYDGRADQIEFFEMVNASDRLLATTELARTNHVDELGAADTLYIGRPYSAVKPGGFLVVAAGDSAEVRQAYPMTTPDADVVYIRASGLTLSNAEDRIRVHDRHAETIADVVYESQWHHPDLAQSRGFSIERMDLSASVDDAANWSTSTAPDGASPGAANAIRLEPREPGATYGITISPSPFSPDGDGHDDAAVIAYHLRSDTPNIRVRIFDVDGFEVRALQPAGLSSGTGRIVWDGRGDDDRPLRIGLYVVVFEAVDSATRRSERYKRPVVVAKRFH